MLAERKAIKVIGMFDDLDALRRAEAEVVERGLAKKDAAWEEPREVRKGLHPGRLRVLWEQLKEWLGEKGQKEADAYAEGVRRGGALLVVETTQDKAEAVKNVLRRNGAVDIGRRVRRWMGAGWDGFEPAGFGLTEEEIIEERRKCIDERATPGTDDEEDDDDNHPERTVHLFDEESGRRLGMISEAELAVLQDALEEEDPHDNDYWINEDEIDDLACRPGATPHLIRLLRKAVDGRPAGIDIAFERNQQPRQSLRRGRAGTARSGGK